MTKKVKKEIFDSFNELINNQSAKPFDVCMFIYSLLHEKGYAYKATECHGHEWTLNDI